MYKLFYSPGSCSLAIHVILNELKQDFTLVDCSIKDGKNRSKEFLTINPRGQVPVLASDKITLRENIAIITYLLKQHPNKLLPKSGIARIKAIEWLAFANSTMHPAYSRCFFLSRMVKDEKTKEELLDIACKRISELWQDVDKSLEKNNFVCGKNISAADIMLTVIANWSKLFGDKIIIGNNCQEMFKKVTALSSFQQALQKEKISYTI